MPPVGIKSSRRAIRDTKKEKLMSEFIYFVRQRNVNGMYYADVLVCPRSATIVVYNDLIQKSVAAFRVCESDEEAYALAERLNKECQVKGIMFSF